jgi:uncharacterized protein with ParB-like and HNH nuclease domain
VPSSNIDSRLMSFGEVLTGSNYYSVPHFQRDYSWTEVEIEELWTDIVNTINENRIEHFVGAIVVNNSDKPNLKLIDGQQRITTISLIMCAVRDIAKEKEDHELALLIAQNYLGNRNLRTRKTDPKLILNDKNNNFYQENFIEPRTIGELTSLKKSLKTKNRNKDNSNALMLNTYLFAYKKLQERIKSSEDFREALIEIEECIKDRLISIIISVADEANSYLIFETLNNRGLELSVADLLKNHLFAKAHEKLSIVQNKWIEINREVSEFEITKFIRHYWISNYKLIGEKELFREISVRFRNSDLAYEFVNSLHKSSEIYGAFRNPQSSAWDSFNSDAKKYISELTVLDTSQCYPMLLAAKECLSDDIFLKVLRIVVVFSFRYSTICGLNPNKLESLYSDVALYIRNQNPKNAKSIFEKLESLYPSDNDFSEDFQKKSIGANSSKLARYILSEINNYYTKNNETIINPNTMDMNLEHILPKNPNDEWSSKFSKTDPNLYTYRLGNLTLIDSAVNRKLGNKDFNDKCSKAFSKSSIELNKEILTYKIWGPKQIEERQAKMSAAAIQIWRLSY